MKKVVIIGAGPAGLAAAYELIKKGKNFDITIIEKSDTVGGLSRTIKYKNSFFDIGPHRFFTKNEEVLKIWKDVLGSEFLKVKRLTRMFYKGKYFLYPVDIKDALSKLEIQDVFSVGFSYLYAKVFLSKKRIVSFEDHIIKYFGRRLYELFFKTYTEKLWGIKCTEISSKWASQRIKNINLWEVLVKSVLPDRKSKAKSFVGEFYYPKYGTGYMYEKIKSSLVKNKVKVILNSNITMIDCKGNKIKSLQYLRHGKKYKLDIDYLISSMPLTELIKTISRPADGGIVRSLAKVYFRDHISINLFISGSKMFRDNWIYIQDPSVAMARVTNFNNMSDYMTPKKSLNAISVEYFTFKNDDIWNSADTDLIELAKKELVSIGLVKEKNLLTGFVVKDENAYPVYYIGYEKYFNKIKNYIEKFSNLETIGRAGMFKYNNMDHSMYSGILAARNVIHGYKKYNTWLVNEDAEYIEEEK